MIDDPVLRELAQADPAADYRPAPDELLLARLLAEPARPRPRRRLLLGPAVVAAAVVVAVVAVVALRSGDPEPEVELAAAAYAQTAADPGEITHTVVTFEGTQTTDAGVKRETGSIEEWHRGTETHRIERYDGDLALDRVLSDGVMRQVDDAGRYRIIRTSDNEDAADVIAREQSGFVADFRQRYAAGELDPAGDVQFAGRPARRYVVEPGRAARMPEPEQAFYIDRETAEPLGYESTLTMHMADGGGEATLTTFHHVQTVRTLEQLPPTAENVAKLRELTFPRRRDADGCIRGPVTDARSIDSASRSDCGGGAPGAPIKTP